MLSFLKARILPEIVKTVGDFRQNERIFPSWKNNYKNFNAFNLVFTYKLTKFFYKRHFQLTLSHICIILYIDNGIFCLGVELSFG